MTLLIALIWLLALIGVGAVFLKQRELGFGWMVLSGGILGSTIAGIVFLTLSHLGQLDTLQVSISTALLCLMGALGWHHLLSCIDTTPWNSARSFWQGLDVWDRRLVWASAFWLLVMLLDAWTPPRAADAMRYHLAQTEDMVRNHGFVFRPYYHYNLPIYYSYLTMPLYFLAGGLGVKLFNFLFAGVVAVITYELGRAAKVRRPLIAVLGVLMTPGILRASTTVNNDLGVIAFGLAGILLLQMYGRVRRRSLLFLAYVSLGYAIGIKYQSVLFVPWYLWFTWMVLGARLDWRSLRLFAVLSLIAVLLPAPFFVRNYLNTGDPVWPLYQDVFGPQHDHVYEMAEDHTRNLTGKHDLETAFSAGKRLLFSEWTIPTMWLFATLGLCRLICLGRDPTALYLAFGVISQLIMWWIVQPALYSRFVNYLVPQLMVIAMLGFDMLTGLWLRRAAIALMAASAGFGLVILAIYSQGLIRYHLDGDLERYHAFTWFHSEYTWMDEHLPDDANVLVVVRSGQTYYVPRNYLRADPRLSALINWRELDSQAFYEKLQNLGVNYLFYQDSDWNTDSPGGAELMALMKEFRERDDVELLWKRDIVLGTSRIRGKVTATQVWMLKLDPRVTGKHPGGQAHQLRRKPTRIVTAL